MTIFENNSEKSSQIILVTAIIVLISSLFMPLFFVFFIQDVLYHSKSHWFFERPASAFIIFMMGMVWISFVLFLHLFVRWKFEIRYFKWITLVLVLLSAPFFMFGVSNYYYFGEKGFHYNPPKTFNEVHMYEWDDFDVVEELYISNNGISQVDRYVFKTKDGKTITLQNNNGFREYRKVILSKLEENKVEVNNNLEELYNE